VWAAVHTSANAINPEPVTARSIAKGMFAFVDGMWYDYPGQPNTPDLAQSQICGQERIPAGDFHEAIRQPPNKSRVERWRREMSGTGQRLFQHGAGELLIELGYPTKCLGKTLPREQTWLMAFRIKYEALPSGQHVLQSVGVLHPIKTTDKWIN
jgi:hypothetical protein